MCWIGSVIAIEDSLVSMAEYDHDHEGGLAVVVHPHRLQGVLDLLASQVLVHPNLEG